MYYIGLDVHKKTISYCVKDAAGKIHQEGKIGSTRRELDAWIKTLPQPPDDAEKVKVAHPLMLRAIAAAKGKNDNVFRYPDSDRVGDNSEDLGRDSSRVGSATVRCKRRFATPEKLFSRRSPLTVAGF